MESFQIIADKGFFMIFKDVLRTELPAMEIILEYLLPPKNEVKWTKLASHGSLLHFPTMLFPLLPASPQIVFPNHNRGKIMVQGYSNGFGIFLVLPCRCSPHCLYTQELVSRIYLSFSPALALTLLQPKRLGDVHLRLLGGHCHLMFVLRALSLALCEPSYGRSVLLSLEFCRSTLHSVGS